MIPAVRGIRPSANNQRAGLAAFILWGPRGRADKVRAGRGRARNFLRSRAFIPAKWQSRRGRSLDREVTRAITPDCFGDELYGPRSIRPLSSAATLGCRGLEAGREGTAFPGGWEEPGEIHLERDGGLYIAIILIYAEGRASL